MKPNSKIAVIGAMDCEIEKIKELLSDIAECDFGGFTIWIGKINNHEIFVSKSGVGKVNSAINTQFLIDKFHPDYVINTGVAGGIDSNLEVGDIVIAEKLVQHDFDATALGYPKGYICNGIMSDSPTYFYSDFNLVELFEKTISTMDLKTKTHRGIIATGDYFIASAEKKQELKNLFNATAGEMEGAAIAQACAKNNTPFVVMRAISDLADCSAPKSLEEVETTMAEFAAETLKKLLMTL